MSSAVRTRKLWCVVGVGAMVVAVVGACGRGNDDKPPQRTACDLISKETIRQVTGGVKSYPPGGSLKASGDDQWTGRCELWAADQSGRQLGLKSAYPTSGAVPSEIEYTLKDANYNDGVWTKCKRYDGALDVGMTCERKANRNRRERWSIYGVYKNASISVVVEPAPGKTDSKERLATAEKVAKEFVDNFVPYADKRLAVTDPSR